MVKKEIGLMKNFDMFNHNKYTLKRFVPVLELVTVFRIDVKGGMLKLKHSCNLLIE